MQEKLRIGIIGSGSWATALAKLMLENNTSINWYFRDSKKVRNFKMFRHNPGYLTMVGFDPRCINFYTDINDIVENSDILVFATPSPWNR